MRVGFCEVESVGLLLVSEGLPSGFSFGEGIFICHRLCMVSKEMKKSVMI
jgi:hypothetical protein